MVAVIKTGHSVLGILNYNEKKVGEGCAACIGAGNFPMDTEAMNFIQKHNLLARRNALNENVKRNSVHISLNFDPSEKYPAEKLMEIAGSYMDKIGFGQQPYLVYEHQDAGHPHIHVISVKVRADGSRIDMHNIGRNQSEKARKEIEQEFGLVKAEGIKTRPVAELAPVRVGRVEYGKTETKKAMTSVLQFVLCSYKYTSLATLNAVLGLYNIKADRGSTDSRIFQSGGLVYRILDQNGKPAGIPIKASDFPRQPTLVFLERQFALNTLPMTFEKKRLRNAVDLAFFKNKPSLEALAVQLQKQGIDMVLRKGDQDVLYGITYVDHNTRCVLNGSVLGKNYCAKAMLKRCSETALQSLKTSRVHIKTNGVEREKSTGGNTDADAVVPIPMLYVWDRLFRPEWQGDYVSRPLKGKRGKKKRRGPGKEN